jgi:protein phosphatase
MANEQNTIGAYTLQVGQATDPGRVREDNEDSFGWFSTPTGELLIVADGMGGHVGGKTAGKLAVEAIRDHVMNKGQNNGIEKGQLLKNALFEADHLILQTAEEDDSLRGMGSTAVVLLIDGDKSWFIHAGDSRIYLYAGNILKQLTKDHSLVQLMEDMGEISHEEAKNFERRNVITQSLGGNISGASITPIVMDCYPGDQFLLCTDGLTEMVPDEEIQKVMASDFSPKEKAKILVDLALDAGGYDNVTVQIAERPALEGKISSPSTQPQTSLVLAGVAPKDSPSDSPPKTFLRGALRIAPFVLLGLFLGFFSAYLLFKSRDLPRPEPKGLPADPAATRMADDPQKLPFDEDPGPSNKETAGESTSDIETSLRPLAEEEGGEPIFDEEILEEPIADIETPLTPIAEEEDFEEPIIYDEEQIFEEEILIDDFIEEPREKDPAKPNIKPKKK